MTQVPTTTSWPQRTTLETRGPANISQFPRPTPTDRRQGPPTTQRCKPAQHTSFLYCYSVFLHKTSAGHTISRRNRQKKTDTHQQQQTLTNLIAAPAQLRHVVMGRLKHVGRGAPRSRRHPGATRAHRPSLPVVHHTTDSGAGTGSTHSSNTPLTIVLHVRTVTAT
jgi:hypothetical protein